MSMLFALVPEGETTPPNPTGVPLRRYPRVDGEHHLLGVVRDGRDPHATVWVRGLLLAIGGGAVLGGIVNGTLAYGFDMYGGLTGVATPLGVVVGAFLGAFTAAMTGTQVARPEVRDLARATRSGDVLHQWGPAPAAELESLVKSCVEAGWRYILIV